MGNSVLPSTLDFHSHLQSISPVFGFFFRPMILWITYCKVMSLWWAAYISLDPASNSIDLAVFRVKACLFLTLCQSQLYFFLLFSYLCLELIDPILDVPQVLKSLPCLLSRVLFPLHQILKSPSHICSLGKHLTHSAHLQFLHDLPLLLIVLNYKLINLHHHHHHQSKSSNISSRSLISCSF